MYDLTSCDKSIKHRYAEPPNCVAEAGCHVYNGERKFSKPT